MGLGAFLARCKHEMGDDIDALLGVLSTCVRKSFGGIDHEMLYARCHSGRTKVLIEAYVEEVVASLAAVQAKLCESSDTRRAVSDGTESVSGLEERVSAVVEDEEVAVAWAGNRG